jgi:hypothetical protein
MTTTINDLTEAIRAILDYLDEDLKEYELHYCIDDGAQPCHIGRYLTVLASFIKQGAARDDTRARSH